MKVAKKLVWIVLFISLAGAQAAERWWEQEPLTILDLHTFAGEIDRVPCP